MLTFFKTEIPNSWNNSNNPLLSCIPVPTFALFLNCLTEQLAAECPGPCPGSPCAGLQGLSVGTAERLPPPVLLLPPVRTALSAQGDDLSRLRLLQ